MSANHARNWQINPEQQPQQSPKKVSVKVKNQGWITRGEKIIYSLGVGACIIAGFFMVSLSSATDEVNRDLQLLENNVEQQKITNDGLAFEVKELSRPERIIAIAEANGLKIQNTEVKQAELVVVE